MTDKVRVRFIHDHRVVGPGGVEAHFRAGAHFALDPELAVPALVAGVAEESDAELEPDPQLDDVEPEKPAKAEK